MESMFRVVSNVLLCLSVAVFTAGCNAGESGGSGGGGENPTPNCSNAKYGTDGAGCLGKPCTGTTKTCTPKPAEFSCECA